MDWDEMARPWLEAAPELEITLRPVLDALLSAAKLSSGENILDVGCGTGPSIVAASEAVGETGHITGVDIAPPLLARAAERVSANVELINADAGTHAFEESHFDVVQSNFGIMFFDDNTTAFANLRKAARYDGRLVATVWGLPSDNPWFSVPRRIVDQIIADVPRPDPAGPGPMRFGDPTELAGLLDAAGWKPSIGTLDLDLAPPGQAEHVAALHMKVTVRMMLKDVDTTASELGKIEDEITEACRDFEINGQIRFPARIHVVTALAG